MHGTHGAPMAGLLRALATRLAKAGVAGLLALAGLLPAACLEGPDERRSGVDDFPNSIYARVEGFLDEKDRPLPAAPSPDSLITGPGLPKAAARAGIPDGLPAPGALLGRAGLPSISANAPPHPALQASAPLSKASAAPGAAAPCTATFTLTVPRTDPATRSRVTTTLVTCGDADRQGQWVSLRIDSVDTVSGRRQVAMLSDADGDGVLTPQGGKEKALASITATSGDVQEQTLIVASFGPDGKWETQQDNLVYSLAWARTSADGKDTLAKAAFRDADGDGIAVDNAKPSLVDVEWYAKGPTADDPDALWVRLSMRTVAVFGVEQGEIRRFAAESETRDGRRNRAVILNDTGGVDVDLRDTVVARFEQVGTAAADSLDSAVTTVRMTTGPSFDLETDDTAYALEVRAVRKLGEERAAAFAFRSDAPIPHGQEPRLGTLTMRIGYADGTALDVEGRITAETLDVTAELRDGKRIHAVWDRQGKGLLLEELD